MTSCRARNVQLGPSDRLVRGQVYVVRFAIRWQAPRRMAGRRKGMLLSQHSPAFCLIALHTSERGAGMFISGIG